MTVGLPVVQESGYVMKMWYDTMLGLVGFGIHDHFYKNRIILIVKKNKMKYCITYIEYIDVYFVLRKK